MVTFDELDGEIARLKQSLADKITLLRSNPLPSRGPSSIIRFSGSQEKIDRLDVIARLETQRDALFPNIPIQNELSQPIQTDTIKFFTDNPLIGGIGIGGIGIGGLVVGAVVLLLVLKR